MKIQWTREVEKIKTLPTHTHHGESVEANQVPWFVSNISSAVAPLPFSHTVQCRPGSTFIGKMIKIRLIFYKRKLEFPRTVGGLEDRRRRRRSDNPTIRLVLGKKEEPRSSALHIELILHKSFLISTYLCTYMLIFWGCHGTLRFFV